MDVIDDCTRMGELESALRQLLQERFPEIRLALLFGSAAHEHLDVESDIDLAVAADRPLSARQRLAVIDAVAMATGRAVDLVDLMQFNYPITQVALRTGRTLFSCDGAFRGSVISRALTDEADFGPIYRREIRRRLEQWPTKSSRAS